MWPKLLRIAGAENAIACTMSIAPARPVVPKSLVLAGVVTVALHALGTVVLSGVGWGGRDAPSRLALAHGHVGVAASSSGAAGVHVRLASEVAPMASASEDASVIEGGSSPEVPHRTDANGARLLLSEAKPPTDGSAAFASTYLSADEVDRGPFPEPGWILDESAFERVGQAHMRLRLWVSERGRIDRVALIHAEPPGEWVERALRPLPDTRMQPAQHNGRPVAATIVIELSADLESMR